ncbi:acyltransferase family protein [Roseobacter litoralis]|uniref:Acyltransferase-like protein n=1 Tax=Roseobacter litoralis (strain ATCC 49566 / DSM 6996 / JCM 21268 / NBRC 15278 / OCh 149) TaxID=391595 RepID=F7ZMM1_ROSLO|nr:acyltransferase family protein [Roseobacter litoralis]AEI96558.1 acyltransferase-like protein [Roseobacter litoralis Och 149]
MKYRPEIDGLRSIAVLAVLFFHLGVPGITGGFTGVDIFFVISGYLITSILMRDLEAERVDLVQFYRRRALRILPGLFAVLIATIALSVFILLPSEMAVLGRSIIAALLFVSNIFFWSELDYFTPDAKENPLLHTWSLGVEEQFYILVPVAMWLVYRYARRFLLPLFTLSVLVSFVLSVYAVEPMPRASFYLLPTRYWELGAGSLLAISGARNASHRLVANGLAAFGLACIAAGLFWLTPNSVFPGPAALLPVTGAVALIAAGRNNFAGRLLSTSGPVWIGKISYSLYLWHWPLIVLWKLRTDPYLSAVEMLTLGLVSIIVAALSTRYVEQPFRKLPSQLSNRRVLWPASAALVLGAAAGWGLIQNPQALRNYPARVVALDAYADYFDRPEFRARWQYHKCHLDPRSGGFKAYDSANCLAADTRPLVLVFGDSHAAHIWGGIAAARPDLNVVQASSTNCRPLPNHAPTTFCHKLSAFIYDEWVPQTQPRTVVLSGVWRDSELPELAAGIVKMRDSGVARVVVLGDTVTYAATLPRILARAALQGREETVQLQNHLRPGQWQRDEVLRAIVTQAGGEHIDLLSQVCPTGPDSCQAWVEGVPLLFDSNHYTTEGAALMGRAISAGL